MKLLMLCREPRLYSCQRLKEAAESCGHQMDILDPNRCILKLDKNQPHFSCKNRLSVYNLRPQSRPNKFLASTRLVTGLNVGG